MKEERALGLLERTWSSVEPAMDKGGLIKPRVAGQGVTTVKGWWANMVHHQFLLGYLEEGLAQSHRTFPQSSVPWAFLLGPSFTCSDHRLGPNLKPEEGLGFAWPLELSSLHCLCWVATFSTTILYAFSTHAWCQ